MKKIARNFLILLSLYLGLHNGYVALWRSDKAEPLQIFPYKAAVYPHIDQDALRAGIPIESPEALSALLGDFLS